MTTTERIKKESYDKTLEFDIDNNDLDSVIYRIDTSPYKSLTIRFVFNHCLFSNRIGVMRYLIENDYIDSKMYFQAIRFADKLGRNEMLHFLFQYKELENRNFPVACNAPLRPIVSL